MLTITSPRVAHALVAGRSRSQRRAAWGSFPQRTASRRVAGAVAAASVEALGRHQAAASIWAFCSSLPACRAHV
jgi:hypothetical protein